MTCNSNDFDDARSMLRHAPRSYRFFPAKNCAEAGPLKHQKSDKHVRNIERYH